MKLYKQNHVMSKTAIVTGVLVVPFVIAQLVERNMAYNFLLSEGDISDGKIDSYDGMYGLVIGGHYKRVKENGRTDYKDYKFVKTGWFQV